MENKRGWIRIVESFVAVLIVTGAILVVINRGYIGGDASEKIYEWEYSTLKEISMDKSMRAEIVAIDFSIEMTDVRFPQSVSAKIRERKPDYLECTSKICNLEDICALANYPTDKDVYAQSISITATTSDYNPKQLKIFCWGKK